MIFLLLIDNKNKMKKKLGQFYTTNYEYIMDGLELNCEKNCKIIEPFVGNGNLLYFISKFSDNIEIYDIDPKIDNTIIRDTILNPPDYFNKFVITNPPFLAKNKSKNNLVFEKYTQDDLYKCFIKSLLQTGLLGGILILPINFLSSVRKNDTELRKKFLSEFVIHKINIFEEKVFDDTSVSVISFSFYKKIKKENIIKVCIYPMKNKIELNLNKHNNYTIGYEIYNLKKTGKYSVNRLTSKNIKLQNTQLYVKCLDSSSTNKIMMSIVDKKHIFIDKTKNLSERNNLSLIILPEVSLEIQNKICFEFNNFLNENRNKYNSLFLSNFRDTTDISRKRISFELIYSIVEYFLDKFDMDEITESLCEINI
jgi:hypothetical protein